MAVLLSQPNAEFNAWAIGENLDHFETDTSFVFQNDIKALIAMKWLYQSKGAEWNITINTQCQFNATQRWQICNSQLGWNMVGLIAGRTQNHPCDS